MPVFCDPPSPTTRVRCPECQWRGQMKQAVSPKGDRVRCPVCETHVVREDLKIRSPHQ
jgi:endogenous inhibitor of DNA gyrase (YacG/DUF329 family)